MLPVIITVGGIIIGAFVSSFLEVLFKPFIERWIGHVKSQESPPEPSRPTPTAPPSSKTRPVSAPYKAKIVDRGRCGKNVTWVVDERGLLTISGTGPMFDYEHIKGKGSTSPWHDRQVQRVMIEYGVTSIGVAAFAWCDSLSSVTIPDSVTSIGDGAFVGTRLRSVTIPDSVTSIGDEAFAWCDSLDGVTIPNSVKHIGEKAFWGCSALRDVILSDRTEFADNAFDENVTEVVILASYK